MNEHFATELLKEVKTNAKRWFIAFCVMVAVEIVTIFGFMWYISLPVEDTAITQDADGNSHNYVVGGDFNGGKTDGTQN